MEISAALWALCLGRTWRKYVVLVNTAKIPPNLNNMHESPTCIFLKVFSITQVVRPSVLSSNDHFLWYIQPWIKLFHTGFNSSHCYFMPRCHLLLTATPGTYISADLKPLSGVSRWLPKVLEQRVLKQAQSIFYWTKRQPTVSNQWRWN